MKRIIVFFLFMFPLLGIWAQGTCDRAFDKAVSLYNNGKYKDAKMQFSWCQTHCKDRSSAIYQGWLDKCETKIKKQEVVAIRRRKAEAEAVARQEAEAKALAERREKNRYVYLSSSSAVKGKFENIEYVLEDKIQELNPDIKFTRDSVEAYWFVRVVINIRGDESNSSDALFYYVEANIEVENSQTAQVWRSFVYEKNGSYTIPAEKAEEWTANKVYEDRALFNKIQDFITKNISK